MRYFVLITMAMTIMGCGSGGGSTSHYVPVQAPTGANVIMIGDSNTALLPSSLLPEKWARMAVGGDTSQIALERCKTAIAIATKPTAIVMAIGTNDTDLSPLVTKQNIKSCLDAANQAGIKAYVVAIPPVNTGYIEKAFPISILNMMLKELAKDKYISLPDEMYYTNGLLKLELTVDGLHFNKTGQKIWIGAIEAFVSKDL